MTPELRELLHEAAGTASHDPDVAAALQRGAALRRRRKALAGAGAAVAVAAVVGFGAQLNAGPSGDVVEPADEPVPAPAEDPETRPDPERDSDPPVAPAPDSSDDAPTRSDDRDPQADAETSADRPADEGAAPDGNDETDDRLAVVRAYIEAIQDRVDLMSALNQELRDAVFQYLQGELDDAGLLAAVDDYLAVVESQRAYLDANDPPHVVSEELSLRVVHSDFRYALDRYERAAAAARDCANEDSDDWCYEVSTLQDEGHDSVMDGLSEIRWFLDRGVY
jgi:hypothetical protein